MFQLMALAPLGKALASPLTQTTARRMAVPAPKPLTGGLDAAMTRIAGSRYQKTVEIGQRTIGHLPSFGRQIDSLSRNLTNPRSRRGTLGELNTAIRLEKGGTKVLDVGRNVYLDGKKFTDIDVMTRRGSAVEVRDWSSKLSISDIRDKADRLSQLRAHGVEVDGVVVRRLFVYAPGGMTPEAAKHLKARDIEVLESIPDLRRVE